MQGPPKAGLSQADAAQLEERALKMRKAMGENISDDVAGETVDARTRRLNLIRCAHSPLNMTRTPLHAALCQGGAPMSGK